MGGMGRLARLSERIGALEERSLERTREKIRRGKDVEPDGKIGWGGVAVWLAMLVWPATSAASGDHGPAWLMLGGLVLFAGIMVLLMRAGFHGTWRLARYLLLLPLLALSLWLSRELGLAANYLVVFPSMLTAMVLPIVVPAFVGILVVTVTSVLVTGVTWDNSTSVALTAFFSGLVMFVLRRLSTTIGLLREAREELARAAVAEERLRFSRDLHDLLGHTLSVVVVKAEVVRRLVGRDPAQAAEAAADIETIGRQALVEVREAVTGYRERDLAAELDGARAALSDAGIAPTVRRAAGTLDDRADALLGWAVREGATNVIRHSRATCCTITLRYDDGRAVLQIADDGTGCEAVDMPAGNGLRGLTERFAAAGGTVRADAGQGGFTLTATVPTRVEPPAVGKMCG
jgi:two-component system, NarL family, sensor histidine kinase DesK